MKSVLGNVLITGGASGLGEATVQAVARHGGVPLVLDKKPPRTDVVGEVAYACADLADTDAVEAAVHALAEQAGGGINAVVTCAGIDSCGRLADVAAKEWEQVVHVNLLGTAAVIRSALPLLSGGRIVTVASTLGIKAVSDATAYCASKFGVVGLTRALAAELAGEVGVTCLIPGGMHTPFFDGRTEQYRPPVDAKLNQPENVAETILFALQQPAGCEVRELVVCASTESSWP
ncbi:SDR family oxidoreductase [Mycobacterium crocinum]|uniref:SDR family oxidoreductase n=1 Tax=Mycolicibacterium crocinum TaxID=388459 RepID=A0ABY3TNL0_9MYCO|nr:SDR family oxidoreductase [Mycolicibacterium crocinum]MCV7215617.1 SDR family oxidoreductase [Mycolicibacterium crocinum]ULN43042.1 SDR family oxidoreductase [Mycolicibacterium crocinum]